MPLQSLISLGYNWKTLWVVKFFRCRCARALLSPRTKHIGVRYHRVRGEVERGAIDARYVPTQDNPADMFTKSLPKVSFVKFREKIGLM